jgi:hypothetical protein
MSCWDLRGLKAGSTISSGRRWRNGPRPRSCARWCRPSRSPRSPPSPRLLPTRSQGQQAEFQASKISRPLLNANRASSTRSPGSDRLADMRNRVCRVELPNMGMGTGCLVGPDLVLTCGHVVDSVVKSAGPGGTPIVRFDFALKGAEVQEGKVYRMHDEWRLASAPYDEGLGLNFVLMRLAASAGEETMSDGDKRGWITLKPAPDPNPGEAISILHHPRAGPMKMSLGALLRIEEQRLFHNALTEPGSSGAPCFSMGSI